MGIWCVCVCVHYLCILSTLDVQLYLYCVIVETTRVSRTFRFCKCQNGAFEPSMRHESFTFGEKTKWKLYSHELFLPLDCSVFMI